MMNIEDQPKISVVIRKRPLNKKEIQRNENDIVVVRNQETVIVSEYKQKVDLTKYIEESSFNFDHAFDESSNNTQIYAKAVRPLVESAFMGAKVTCFAYGQTGSGKTYTMNGDIANGVEGLYILGAKDIFNFRSNKQFQHLKIQVSFFEIYCSRLFDLLNNRNQLKIREDNKGNVHIVGLEQKPLNSAQEFMNIIEYGSGFRVTSQNSTNADSSRSHAILQITLKEGKKVYGKISFIDLAGCQRGADHMDQNKQTRIDGAEINKSLLSLKQCIRALDQGKGHTPFRGSKLTMVLKDSFVGFCRTVMIGNISPNISSCQNTLNTLRYADRVKQLKKPNSNEPLSKQDQLAKELMLPRQNNNAVKIMIDKDDDAEDIQMKKEEAQKLLGIKNLQIKPTLPQQSQTPFGQNNTNLMRAASLNPDYGNFNMNNQMMNNGPKKMVIENQQIVKKFSIQQKGPVLRFDQLGESKNGYQNQLSLRNEKANYLQDQKPVKQNSSFTNGNKSQMQNIINGNSLKEFQQTGNTQVNNHTFKNISQNYGQQQLQNNFQFQNQQQRSFNPYGLQPQQNQTIQFNMKMNQQSYGQKSMQFNQFPSNYQNQNHSQNQYQYPQQQQQIQRSFSMNQNLMNSSTPNNNNFNSNAINSSNNFNLNNKMHQENNNINTINRQNINPSKKNDWESMIVEFKNWNPTHNNNLGYFRQIHQCLINKLVQQQDEITQLHSTSINKQIQLIKGQTKVISQIQQDKQAYDSMEYAQYIENTIEKKINHLLEIKKRVEQFKQHLRQHQECQQKLFRAKQILDDEQLLDDLPAEDCQFNDFQNQEDTYQMQQYNQPLY